MKEAETKVLPRSEVPVEYTWNLEKLFPSEEAWENGLEQLKAEIPQISTYRGTLHTSAEHLAEFLDFITAHERLMERLGYYAHLRISEDVGNSSAQERFSRYMNVATQSQGASSFQTPEIQAIPEETMQAFLDHPKLSQYRIVLTRILRFKPHILSEAEEKLFALQNEAAQTPSKGFSALTDVDMNFGTIQTPEGERPLTQSSLSSFLLNPDRKIRKKAYLQFYQGYEIHKNT